MTHHDRPEDHTAAGRSDDSGTGDPGTDRASIADLPPEDVAGHPSRAAGEDPDATVQGEDPDLGV